MSAKASHGSGALHAQMQEEKVGLLRKVAPVHSGLLRRRTRFIKASHFFEIRSSVLLLYKSRRKQGSPTPGMYAVTSDCGLLDNYI